jgi:hypothetical protein
MFGRMIEPSAPDALERTRDVDAHCDVIEPRVREWRTIPSRRAQ